MTDGPARGGDRPRKPAGPRGRGGAGGRGAADRAGAGRPRRDGEQKPPWKRDGAAPKRDARPPHERESDSKPRNDDPHIPDEVLANQLDKVARAELKTLSKENADWVAKHLVMAARVIDEDPELAHRHALAAQRRAGRVGVVRETVAITAYATGDFALALRELRTHRRISGSNDQLPLMVDSERGVGRPDRALELGRSVPRAELPVPVQVALAIAMSGARLDLGQADAALLELQIPQLDPDRAFEWSPALFDAYATVLEELGRDAEAAEWFARAERAANALATAADPDGGDIVEIVEEEDA
jgi:ribosomal protein L15